MSQLGTPVSSKFFELLPQQPAQNCRSSATSSYAETEPQTNIESDNAKARLQKHLTSRENVARAATASSTGTPTIVRPSLCNLTWHLPQHIYHPQTRTHMNTVTTATPAPRTRLQLTIFLLRNAYILHSRFASQCSILTPKYSSSHTKHPLTPQLHPNPATRKGQENLISPPILPNGFRASFGNRSPLQHSIPTSDNEVQSDGKREPNDGMDPGRVQEQDGEQHFIACSVAAAPVPKASLPCTYTYSYTYVNT